MIVSDGAHTGGSSGVLVAIIDKEDVQDITGHWPDHDEWLELVARFPDAIRAAVSAAAEPHTERSP